MSKQKSARKESIEFKYDGRTRDLPATQGMLHLVRSELKAEMRSGFSAMDAKFEKIISEIHQVGLLVEEQHSRNAVVMEGLTGLWQRQERAERRADDFESVLRSLARPRA